MAIGEPAEDERVDALISEVDVDGSGTVEFGEFLKVVAGVKKGGNFAAVVEKGVALKEKLAMFESVKDVERLRQEAAAAELEENRRKQQALREKKAREEEEYQAAKQAKKDAELAEKEARLKAMAEAQRSSAGLSPEEAERMLNESREKSRQLVEEMHAEKAKKAAFASRSAAFENVAEKEVRVEREVLGGDVKNIKSMFGN